jgi:hypothetical protein
MHFSSWQFWHLITQKAEHSSD